MKNFLARFFPPKKKKFDNLKKICYNKDKNLKSSTTKSLKFLKKYDIINT